VLLEDDHAEEGDTPENDPVGRKNHDAEDLVVDVVAVLHQRAAPCYQPHAGIHLGIRDHKPFQSPLGVTQVSKEGVLLIGGDESQNNRKQSRPLFVSSIIISSLLSEIERERERGLTSCAEPGWKKMAKV
jgi:hypothetical protein